MQNQPPQNTPWDVILRRVRNAPPTSSPPPHTPLPFTNPNWLNTPLSIRLTVRRWVIIALVILIVLIGGILLGRLSLSVSGNQSQVTQPNNSNPPNSQQNIVPQVPTDTPTPTPTPPPQPGTILYQSSSDNWQSWNASGHWYIQNNQLLNDGNGTPPLLAPYNPVSPDYAVEAKITKIKSTDNIEDSFGLVVRGTSDNGGYTLSICFTNNFVFGTTSGCANKDYNEALLLKGQDFPEGGMLQYFAFQPNLNQEYTYRIEVKGQTISAFIDGHALFPPVTDLTYKDAGQISIWSSNCQIIVSSFTIIAL